MSVKDLRSETVRKLAARPVRSVHLRTEKGARIEFVGCNAPAAADTPPSAGIVEVPAPVSFGPHFAELIAAAVVERLGGTVTSAARTVKMSVTGENDNTPSMTATTSAPTRAAGGGPPALSTPDEAAIETVLTPSSGDLAAANVAAPMSTSAIGLPGNTSPITAPVATVASAHTQDGLLTVNDVAALLAVKRSKAYEIWARLPKVRLGPRCVRVRRAAFDDFLRERERRPRWG